MTDDAKAALIAGLNGRTPNTDALLNVDVNAFVADGTVDAAAISAWVEANSTPIQVRRAIDLGGGRSRGESAGASKGVGAGRDLFTTKKGGNR